MRVMLLALPEEKKVVDYATPNHFNDYIMQYPPLGLLCLVPALLPRQPADIDGLPLPNRSLLRPEDYYTAADRGRMTTVFSSRGCPFRCVFCDVPDKSFHPRSPRRLADEFAAVVAQGYDEIHVFDDAFN